MQKKLQNINPGLKIIFSTSTGTARGVTVYEQQFIVSDSVSCVIPSVIYTRLANRIILQWIRTVTGEAANFDKRFWA